jgi:hypothetical protein
MEMVQTVNIFAFTATDKEAITLTGGGTFNLHSSDLAISWYDPNAVILLRSTASHWS